MKYFIPFVLLISGFITAQEKKIGVVTSTPTEVLDVNGTMRIRDLPNTNTTYTDGKGTTKTFNPVNPVVSSKEGFNIIGQNSKAELVPNNNSNNFNTTNNSSAMFVIKRFKVGDWPSQSGDVGITTGMYISQWEAIMSNVSFTFSDLDWVSNVFNELHLHSWTMFVNTSGEWRIKGDINGIREKSDFVDVLFIKKGVVAAEARTGKFNY